jgi:2-oxoisovalerate dehydrogenase E1 component
MDNVSRKLAATPESDTATQLALEHAYGRMALIRAVEERLLGLFSEGKLFGTTHTCIGQETCAYAVIGALDTARDIVFSNHRCHGHYVMYGDDAEGLIAEIMGRATGVCGGRGGSQHLCADGFYSNGIQGGIVPVAAGMALAEKMKGSGAVTVVFLGDGTLGEGAVYEALNIAALWELPVLFVVEHNQWAQSTPTTSTIAGDVLARAEAFGIATDRRPARDPVALQAYMAEVVEGVRLRGRPFFQVLDTFRLAAHSKGDDDRCPDLIARARGEDPLGHLRATLDDARAAAIDAEVRARVQRAVEAADAAPFASLDGASEEQALQRVRGGAARTIALADADRDGEPRTVVQSLNQAHHDLMQRQHDVLLIGEDLLDPYGGAFKVSRGLSTKFPDRVRSTPISESAIIGIANGMSLRGYRPIAEIMFGDFLALCADQLINHLAKFHWMYNGQVETPVVVRAPVGGRRGYGPTHSQCIEKIFFGIPGLVLVAVSTRHDPGLLLTHAVEDERPVIFLEQKLLYGKRLKYDAPPGLVLALPDEERSALYPTGVWRPDGETADLTLVTYGEMTEVAEEAMTLLFDEDELLVEYVVVSQLAPLRAGTILDSVRRTKRLVVLEEGTEPWGFGAEVLARAAEALGPELRGAARVAAHHLPVPNARPMEDAMLPDAARVVAAARRVVRGSGS